MAYIDITKVDEKILLQLDTLASKFQTGIINHFHAYVKRVSRNVVRIENDKIYVPGNLIDDEYIKRYFDISSETDFRALDCAYLAIHKIGIPPENEMKLESLEKK